MQTLLTTETTWYLIAKEPETGIPPRIAITPPFRIGRREGFDLCLSCRNVSGLHAELLQEHGLLWIEDLNSTNGTFVNGARIRKKTTLKDGDSIQFGQSIFTIACLGDDNEAPGENVSRTLVAVPTHETTEERFERLLKNGVVPFFQPIYNISGDSMQRIGYEVLGRSRLFGLNTPDQMFAIATDLEKESELSRTLRLRGIEAAESNFAPDMMLFVNTHPAEMDCQEIQESLKEIRSQFPTRPIMLELSEQVLYSPDDYSQLIRTIKDLGVQLVLHDFGAGQIRLAELAELGPEIVKFDCALLQGIDKADEKRIRLVTAMVKMVAELGITPMAEYVETQAEHDALKELGFELVQGFHYGHPAAIETLIDAPESPEAAADASRASYDRPLDLLKALERSVDETPFGETAVATYDFDETQAFEEYDTTERSVEIVAELLEDIETPAQRDSQWLMDQDDDCFTLQIMFSAIEDKAVEFLAECDEPGDYAIYRKWSSNREWHVVVFGIFDSRDEAKSAMEPFAKTGHSTWIRELYSVKEEILSIDNIPSDEQ